MKVKLYIGLVVGVTLLLAPALVAAEPAVQEGQNLLTNSSFEGSYKAWNNIPQIQMPKGWSPWWIERSDGDETWQNHRPEWKPAEMPYAGRIHSGSRALQYFKSYATYTAGAYQRVAVGSGATVRGSAWGQAWSCENFESCSDAKSWKPANMNMKVCIDPAGGSSPFAPGVVCSAAGNPLDAYQQLSTPDVVATADKVTLFLVSQPDWPKQNQDTYWDDASLVIVAPAQTPTNTPPPPPPTRTPGPPPTPLATATPRPDGATVHTVQSGETMWAIAIQYANGSGMDANQMLAQINQLNNNPTMIYPGQELVIAVPQNPLPAAATTAPESEPEPTAALSSGQPAAASNEQVAAPVGASSSSLCVSAYHDRNADGMYDPATEELLPDAGFTLSNPNGVVGSYTSDGMSEPYCFNQLIPGTYMVQLSKPAGYNTTTPEYWAVPLPAGATASVEFGNQRDPNAPLTSEQAAVEIADGEQSNSLENLLQAATDKSGSASSEEKTASPSLLSRLGDIVVGVSGIFVLLLAGAVGVAFVASRRRA